MPGVSQAQCWEESRQPQCPPTDHLRVWASSKVGRVRCRIFIQRKSSKAPTHFQWIWSFLNEECSGGLSLPPSLPIFTLDQAPCSGIKYGNLFYQCTLERKMHHFCMLMEETPAGWVLLPQLCLPWWGWVGLVRTVAGRCLGTEMAGMEGGLVFTWWLQRPQFPSSGLWVLHHA